MTIKAGLIRRFRSLADTGLGRRLTWEAMDALGVGRIEMRRDGDTFAGTVRDKMISYELFSKGHFDKHIMDQALSLAIAYAPDRRGLCFIDIGANIGTNTVYALKRPEFVSAVCFEPDPDNFESLSRTLAANGLSSRATAHQTALGVADGEALLTHSADNHGDHRIAANDAGTIRVPVRRFDGIDLGAAGPIGLITLDVQGFEAQVLSGATKLLETDAPLLCEITPSELAMHGDAGSLIRVLMEHYHWFTETAHAGPPQPIGKLPGRIAELPRGWHLDPIFTKRKPTI